MRFRRFEVEGESMSPTLAPGDFVIGVAPSSLAPSDIVAFEHPGRSGFWLIKRVITVSGTIDLDAGTMDGSPYLDPHREPLVETGRFDVAPGTMFVMSDNRRSTRADSRVFGAVSFADSYRIPLRYWPNPTRL
jgi:signal peptidase I